MTDPKILQEKLIDEFGKRGIESTALPQIITQNLNPKFPLRPYQVRAFQFFSNYWNESFEGKPEKHQLLFHMATGSGKTLIMAGLILYLYEKGYRNFLFFVNSSNIIKKTIDNFLNDSSIKYLFNSSLKAGDKKINIREVENFQGEDENSINIAFSTIQGLHTRLANPKENAITFEDFENRKIVLISDEAHHINVETKAGVKTDVFGQVSVQGSLSKEEAEEMISWESTVNRIFNANSQNVLLEFTATIDFADPSIASKYASRLIFDYQLKQFRMDKFSKDVKTHQVDSNPLERALQAIILSQYRRKVFENNKIIIKPVILFKSKTIKESEDFLTQFSDLINKLRVSDLQKIDRNASGDVMRRAFDYFKSEGISLENLVEELKGDFSEEKCIAVNSKDESEEKQIAINSLESPTNEYRAVFAVDKLNEGWDVLNLFDIVRLYDTRDAKAGKGGKTTTQEAQLIGRGARYCPFNWKDLGDASVRKFDNDLGHQMRICEELYYHSSYNPKYIQELNAALVKTGILADKTIQRSLAIKDAFKATKFYKSGYVFLNERHSGSREDASGIPSSVRETLYRGALRTGANITSNLFEEQSGEGISKKEKDFAFKDFDKTIVRKALMRLDFFEFKNLKKLFPTLETLDEFIEGSKYLSDIKVTLSGTPEAFKDFSPDSQLKVLVDTLEQIAQGLSSENLEYRGSRDFKAYPLKEKITDKVLTFNSDESEDKEVGKSISNALETALYLDLSDKSWHVFNDCFGTSEEKHFIHYVDKVYSKLKDKYDEIFLVRNERFVKLFNFEDGRPLEPDYILFLSQQESGKKFYYQVFIEPKGKHLKDTDAWKESFLMSLKKEHKLEVVWEDKNYVIWGMPFYSHSSEVTFDTAFKEEILS